MSELDVITVGEDDYRAFLQVLRDFRIGQKLNASGLRSSCLVSKKIMEKPKVSRLEALKEILTEILALLEEENPSYADILRGRFWEGRKVAEMLDSGRPWGKETVRDERSFLYHQKKAVTAFAFWYLKKEQTCLEQTGAQVLPLATHPIAAAHQFISACIWWSHKGACATYFLAKK